MSSFSPQEEHKPLPYPGILNAWLAFIRPKTCSIAISPVIAALSLAYVETNSFDLLKAAATILLAVLVIVLSNMQNDLGYTQRKAEKGNRKGLPRATSNNWISIKSAQTAIASLALLALVDTILLSISAGWGFIIVGLLCIIAAYCYMGGPKPLAYGPFSEAIVLIFYGLVAVVGTYYIQTHEISSASMLLGLAVGSIASAVLCVNNFRDHEHDRSVGRQTLAVVIGESAYKKIFISYMTLPYVMSVAIAVIHPALTGALAAFATIPQIPRIINGFQTLKGYELNQVMFSVIQLEVKYSLAFSVGILASNAILQ